MNRHQRRKQKKEQKVVQPFPKELEEIIKTHLNKNYDHAEEE